MKKPALLSLILLVIAGGSLFSCKDAQENISAEDRKALSLIQTNCFSCHTPELGIDKRLGPPMFRVREHYYSQDISRDEFINKIVRFAENPSWENSIMPGAIRNFGLMPKQTFKREDLEVIAGYIYDNDLSSDAWYAKWEKFRLESFAEDKAMTFEERGSMLVNSTRNHLVKHLMEAITSQGTVGAVEYCNIHAMALTDSVASVSHAVIRRVSDQPRNPANMADSTELAYILEQKAAMADGKAAQPKIFVNEGKMTGYYPILTANMCLQCHGVPGGDIASATAARIDSLYPQDKAKGYAENQVRGLFVVRMQ